MKLFQMLRNFVDFSTFHVSVTNRKDFPCSELLLSADEIAMYEYPSDSRTHIANDFIAVGRDFKKATLKAKKKTENEQATPAK